MRGFRLNHKSIGKGCYLEIFFGKASHSDMELEFRIFLCQIRLGWQYEIDSMVPNASENMAGNIVSAASRPQKRPPGAVARIVQHRKLSAMKPVLVIYATREGHTRHIAEDVGETLGARQFSFDVIDAARIPTGLSLKNYSGAIVGASLHLGKHEPEIVKFVKDNLAELQQIPTLFLSVSLSEVTVEDANAPPEKRAEAQADVTRTIDGFLAETGWHPSASQRSPER